MALRVIGVRQLRDELASVLEELAETHEIVITRRGEGTAVLVDLERYNQLLDRLEYLEDSSDAYEAERDGAAPVRDLD